MAFRLLDLPVEIRLQIYSWVVGNRLIHINDSSFWSQGRLSHYVCRQKLSEMDIFQLFITPPTFKNRIDFHLRPCEEPREVDDPHSRCSYRCRGKPEMLDLRLLATSSSLKKEATKLIYLTNTFSFDDLKTLKRWLQMGPSHLLAYVRHLNIEMYVLRGLESFGTVVKSGTTGWNIFFYMDFKAKLPHITSLSISVHLIGLVTCWLNTSKGQFMNIFRPLCYLKDLRTFTIVINELGGHDSLMHPLCDDQEHDKRPRYTFWKRKELRRVWAEEIREMVLGGH